MTIRELVYHPDERLRVKCRPVEDVRDPAIQRLIDDMVETMYDAPGVGLAAPQVGADVRICVVDVHEPEEEPALFVFVNPEIVEREGKITWEEGCLSIPGVYEDVQRAAQVRVRALDRRGEVFEVEAEKLLAVCIQHEIDHLDGVLFLDHLSRLKLRMALKKYKTTLPRHLEEQEEKRRKREEGGSAEVSVAEPGAEATT